MSDALTNTVARAMCYERHSCWSIVDEVMEHPDYKPGHEGDAGHLTQAGELRAMARAAIKTLMPLQVLMKSESNGPYPAMCWSNGHPVAWQVKSSLSAEVDELSTFTATFLIDGINLTYRKE